MEENKYTLTGDESKKEEIQNATFTDDADVEETSNTEDQPVPGKNQEQVNTEEEVADAQKKEEEPPKSYKDKELAFIKFSDFLSKRLDVIANCAGLLIDTSNDGNYATKQAIVRKEAEEINLIINYINQELKEVKQCLKNGKK
ncbi:hypothetical protein [Veillonella seminalis]|uniref:Uncharacterized protein n=1 Tax=Veillonella seminalis ACS-216-V-Col6b TaxID=883156 RepID=K9DJ22_9FIRM|nr:hypothetical protein [Veillonella seminalis]EKU77395.1 hypothetical protein HMPREF9282_02112 [Veillonella seminalis ACS-216-V-Col6b]